MKARGRYLGTGGQLALATWLALLLNVPAAAQKVVAIQAGDERATGSWLSLAVDQMAVDQLELADMQINSGNFVEAAKTLQAILDAPDQWLSAGTTGGEFVGSHEAANRRIAALPDVGRKAYQRLAEPLAAGLLEQALNSHDFSQLRETATRFALTPSGQKARSACAALLRDQGWVQTADVAVGKDSENETADPPTEQRSGSTPPSVNLAVSSPDVDQLRKIAISIPEWMRQPLDAALNDAYANCRHPLFPAAAVQTSAGIVTSTPFGIGSLGSAAEWSEESVLAKPRPAGRDDGDLSQHVFQSVRLTSLATDGERIFQLSTGRSSRTEQEQSGDEVLVGRSGDGGEDWEVDPFPMELRFLSPPVFGLDRIWLLAESRTAPHVELIALDPLSGELLSRSSFGEALRSWEQDTPRQRHAARIVIDRDAILCLTAAGAIVAIEPLTGERLWAYRYPRSDAPQQPREPGQPVVDSVEWSIPRRAHVVSSAENLVFVSPDSDVIHVLDRATGELVRQLPSRPADRLLKLDGKELLVEAVDSIRTVDVTSGSVTWSRQLNWPAARGVLVGDTYAYPAHGGVVRTIRPGTSEPAGHAEWRVHDVDESGWLAGSRPEELVALLHVADEWLLISAATDVTQGPGAATRDPSDELLKIRALVERFDQFLTAEDWPRAASTWENLMQHSPEQRFIEIAGELQTTRLDRWVQGRLHDVRRKLAPAELATFDGEFLAAYMRLREDGTDPLTQLWDRCGEFPWVWEDRIAGSPTAAPAGSLISLEIQLLRQVQSAEGALQAAAMFRLAQLHVGRAQWEAAHSWLTRLSELARSRGMDQLAPGVFDGAAVTGLQKEADEQLALKRTWSKESVPVLAQQERLSTDIIRTPVPVEFSYPQPWQRMTVELGWPGGRELHLARADWQQPELVRLPAADNAYRTDRSMVRVWSVGEMLVLQAGAEVFGIAAHTDGGTPLGTVMWTRNSPHTSRSGRDSQDDSLDAHSIEAGFRRTHQKAVTRNLYGLPAGLLGPVGPGYALLRQNGMLMALDPATGAELWRRCDLPAECSLFGDAQHVVAMTTAPLDGPRIEVLSAIDGQLVQRAESTIDPSSILQAMGTRVLVHTRQPADQSEPTSLQRIINPKPVPLSLELVDLVDQKPLWQRQWGVGALAFEIDGHRFGVAQPNDQLEFVDLNSGTTLSTTRASLPSPMQTAACSVTDDALLIAVSGPRGERLLPRGYDRENTRRIDLNGQLIACDAEGKKVLWQRELKNTSWPLDQPPDLPVIVISEVHSQGDYAPMSSRLRVLDKRTGEQLLQEEQSNRALMNVVVTGQLARRVVRLRTQYRIIEFRYKVRHHP